MFLRGWRGSDSFAVCLRIKNPDKLSINLRSAVYCRYLVDWLCIKDSHYHFFFFLNCANMKWNLIMSQLQTTHLSPRTTAACLFTCHYSELLSSVLSAKIHFWIVNWMRSGTRCSCQPFRCLFKPMVYAAVNIFSPCVSPAASATLIFTSSFTHRNRKEKQHAETHCCATVE